MRENLRPLENYLIDKYGSISEAARVVDFDQSDLQKFLNGGKDYGLAKFALLLHRFGLALSFDTVENGFVRDRFNINNRF